MYIYIYMYIYHILINGNSIVITIKNIEILKFKILINIIL